GGSLGTGEPLASFGVHWCIDSSHQLPPLQSASTLQLPSGSHWPLALHMPLSQEAPPVAPGAVVLHALPLTILHVASQVSPAPPLLPPSLQPSPASRTPLPQLFAAEQRPGAAWPVVSQMPLSHEALPVEPGAVALHALPLTILQLPSQVAPAMPLVAPSSQPSPASRTPLPQAFVAAQTPGAPPVVLHRPLSHEALPVEPGAVALHALPLTILQLASQLAPGMPLVMPSSQPSPASRTPLPQLLVATHTPGAPPIVLHRPLSHEALPVAPGAVALHASPVTILQLASQASPAPPLLTPWSQPSPVSRTPLPQTFAAEHTPGAAWPVVSQMPLSQELLPVEPGAVALQALPVTILQLASQASPAPPLLAPWSQPSPASRTPLPQLFGAAQMPGAPPVVLHSPLSHEALPVAPGAVALHALPVTILQLASQASPAPPLLPPSSQPSPASRTPLPHTFAAEHTPGAAWPVVSQMPLSQELLPV